MSKDKELTTVSINEKVVDDFLFTTKTKLTKEQIGFFKALCIRNQLDPFRREIYAIPYKNEFNVVTGYEVYLKRAELSGQLDGWKTYTEGKISDNSLKAIVEIKRKDWSEIFRHEVYFKEYNLNTYIWKNKPITMIKKVAIAHGFRLAFPVEVGGLPYTSDEISIKDEKADVSQPKPEKLKTTKPIPADKPKDDLVTDDQLCTITDLLISMSNNEDDRKIIYHYVGDFEKDNNIYPANKDITQLKTKRAGVIINKLREFNEAINNLGITAIDYIRSQNHDNENEENSTPF